MKLILKHFSELTPSELYKIIQARIAVFVVEQECAYQELDGKDLDAWHLWYEDEDGVSAYVRLLDKGVSYPDACSIGRVITVKRGTGLGLKIMLEAVRLVREKYGCKRIRIGAQRYAKGFYEKAGFIQSGGEYLEDGIIHIEMTNEGDE